MLENAMKRVSVIGAAGKMGRGISLLLLQEMACQEAEQYAAVGNGQYKLFLIDPNEEALEDLRHYIRPQLVKFAERRINKLRRYFQSNSQLIDNEEIIRAFIEGAMDMIHLETSLERAKGSTLVFEAAVEDIELKGEILSKLSSICGKETFYLTNTSSVPISVLNDLASLNNNIIGFHFYNPPPVQKLVELIPSRETNPQLLKLAQELGKNLGKIVVPSKDVAGFIGNGHFMREIVYACKTVRKLAEKRPLIEAIYLVNRVSKDFMLRPMGIFQLMDYVGIDICHKVCHVMNTYIEKEEIFDPLIKEMLDKGIRGGQTVNGSQKDGFFSYKGHRPVSIINPEEGWYQSLDNCSWIKKCDDELGPLPSTHAEWKALQRDPDKIVKMNKYFQELLGQSTLGSEMAKRFLLKSKEIGEGLVDDGVAQTIEDVNTILKNGFGHLYGVNYVYVQELVV